MSMVLPMTTNTTMVQEGRMDVSDTETRATGPTVGKLCRYALLVPCLGLLLVGGCTTTVPMPPRRERPAQAASPALTPAQLYAETNVQEDLIPHGIAGRRFPLRMQPQYITIHSTQNPTGDAYAHAQALKRGNLRGGRRTGYLFWHYTVQEDVAIQHLPTDEAGEHADKDGSGNRYSIGIEMCEHDGNDLVQTVDRTARLAAWLMWAQAIPLTHVVPHYHWPRAGYNPPNKNCPHFLLDDGQPGVKWQGFLAQVQAHHQRLSVPPTAALPGWRASLPFSSPQPLRR